MKRLFAPEIGLGAGALIAPTAALNAQAGPPANWSSTPTKSEPRIYPGQSGCQWLRSNPFPDSGHPNWIIDNASEPASGQQRWMDTVVSVRKA